MTAKTDKSRQIRLSGDPEFQRRLREARLLFRRLNLGEGHLNDVGILSLHVTTADDIIKLHRSGRYAIASSQAQSPDPRSLVVSGAAVDRLDDLRSEMIARGENDINLRAIVHYAVCSLSKKKDKYILSRIPRDLS